MTVLSARLAQLGRGVRAEGVRAGGLRSPLLLGGIPAGVLLPLVVAFAIASVAERISRLRDSQITVTAVTSTNSVYWVLTFTPIVAAIAAAYAQAVAMRGPGRDADRYLYPAAWTSPVARWLFYGVLAAVVSAVLVAVTMSLLPALFPTVYGDVDLFSPEGRRFLVTVPVYAFFACGLGTGLVGLIGHPAGTVAVLLFWVFVGEDAIVFVPNGLKVQAYMPFLNGVWGTGQDLFITPPWDQNGALRYYALVCLGVFALGCGAVALRRRRS